ncbi:MAG: hypothetical protein M1822_009556 [Bathelium mastoideum]|nr:MAG: hypothetical protein M1822_009556 [Bathelium mastoideum]
MPGRVSAKSARSSAISRKSSVQTLNSRASASARPSTNSADIPDEGPDSSLRKKVCLIFADAQRSAATHRKSVINLRKVQEACCYEPTSQARQQTEDDFDEDDFANEILRGVARMLTIKKSEPVGDRLVRFLGLFLKHATEKDHEINRPADTDETETFPETPSSRLATSIISLLLQLLPAKDKVVRFRATQVTSFIINTLDFIDDELFDHIRLGLLKRLRDKEPSVRVQAVHGLGRLAGEGDAQAEAEDSEDESTASGVLEKLLDVLQNDPSGDVRRTLLLNLPLTPATLPYLLERARDVDGATRRALYARLLPALGDFRHLSLTHREKLLRWGLRDRDDAVRKATARLFRERWIEDVAASHRPQPENENEDEANKDTPPQSSTEPSYDGLLELLERIDIVNSGGESGIALEAMHEFWDGRPDYREAIALDDAFWNDLTPESAFIVRTLNGYCRSDSGKSHLVDMIETKMPEVTRFAFLLEKQINALIEQVKKIAAPDGEDQDGVEAEEDTVQQEFVVEQMLHIALSLDYSDEIGRRKMSSLVRESLARPELPEESTKLAVEVLRSVCGPHEAGEREFCEVVLEAIAEVHDTIMGDEPSKMEDDDESFHSARSELSSDDTLTAKGKKSKKGRDDSEMSEDATDGTEDEEKAIKEIMVNMKCLHLAQCMLQNVSCNLEQNSHLVTMLNNLVVPAVRSQEAPIRERGLLCLGLCCLLGKNLASENITLFLHCFARGHPALQIISLQIITDILTAHPSLLANTPASQLPSQATPPTSPSKRNSDGTIPSPLLAPILKTFKKALRHEDPHVQSTAVLSLSKLLLARNLADPSLLQILLRTHFSPDPETRGNAATRQTLAYFLPVYCRSRREHASAVVDVLVSLLRELLVVAEEAAEDDDPDELLGDWIGVAAVGAQVVDWTDPRRAMGSTDGGEVDGAVHHLLASHLLSRILTPGCTREERKLLLGTLGKVAVLSSASRPDLVRENLEMVEQAIEAKVANEAAARNVLVKMETGLRRLVDALGEETGEAGSGASGDLDVTEEEKTEAGGGGGEETKSLSPLGDVLGGSGSDDMPEAEGTVLGNEDDEVEPDPTIVGTTNLKSEAASKQGGRDSLADESAVQSLLESWASDADSDLA